MTLSTTSATEVRLEDWIAVVEPSVTVPAPAQHTSPVDAAVADLIHGTVGDERTEQGKDDDEDVSMTSEGLGYAAPNAVSDALGAVTDQVAATAAPVLGEGGDDSASPLSVGSSTLVYALSSGANVAGQMPEREPVDAVKAVTGADVDEAAGGEMPVTLDDIHAAIESFAPGGQTEREQPDSSREALVEKSAVIPAAALGVDGELGAGEEANEAVQELVDGDTASAQAFFASPEGNEPVAAISDDPVATAVSLPRRGNHCSVTGCSLFPCSFFLHLIISFAPISHHGVRLFPPNTTTPVVVSRLVWHLIRENKQSSPCASTCSAFYFPWTCRHIPFRSPRDRCMILRSKPQPGTMTEGVG